MLRYILPYIMFLSRGGDAFYRFPISMTYSRQEQWASISYARKHNRRGKVQRRMKR